MLLGLNDILESIIMYVSQTIVAALCYSGETPRSLKIRGAL